MSSAKSVAKELIRLSLQGPMPDPLTYYRLNALACYAQAWSLFLRDSELFPDEMVSLDEGPVIPALLHVMNGNPLWQIADPVCFNEDPGLDDSDEALFLSYLWGAYGYLSPSGLWGSIQSDPSFLKAKQERENGGKGLIGMNDLSESFSRRSGLPAPLDQYRQLREKREKEAEQAILSSPPLDRVAIWKDCPSHTPSATKQ
jgi:uncharacterized phage-associated protein